MFFCLIVAFIVFGCFGGFQAFSSSFSDSSRNFDFTAIFKTQIRIMLTCFWRLFRFQRWCVFNLPNLCLYTILLFFCVVTYSNYWVYSGIFSCFSRALASSSNRAFLALHYTFLDVKCHKNGVLDTPSWKEWSIQWVFVEFRGHSKSCWMVFILTVCSSIGIRPSLHTIYDCSDF